jgi:hypothetical protein
MEPYYNKAMIFIMMDAGLDGQHRPQYAARWSHNLLFLFQNSQGIPYFQLFSSLVNQ